MHILLTDLLCCPRCGPEFGLILLADTVENRRVLRGALGCPNCREQYPVEEGFADLRPPPRSALPASSASRSLPLIDDESRILEVAALLGVREGPGYLVLGAGVGDVAPGLADLVEGIEVVTLDPALHEWDEAEGVSRIAAGTTLPFFSRRMRGVLMGGSGSHDVRDAARVVGPGSRLAVANPPGEVERVIQEQGLEIILAEERAVVGVRN